MSFKMSYKLAALVGAVLGLGILGFAPTADAVEIVKPTDYEKIPACAPAPCHVFDLILKPKSTPPPTHVGYSIEMGPGPSWGTFYNATLPWTILSDASGGAKSIEMVGGYPPGLYRVQARAKYGDDAPWSAWSPWRHFCVGTQECLDVATPVPPGKIQKELIPIPIPGPPPYAERLRRDAERLTPHQQSPEAQLLLRDIQALQRELAASPQPKEAERLRRDAERLGREVDRLEARLLREQQRAGGPAPAKPEATAPGSQPDQPSGPPQVAAVPRPAPARDPVAEEAAKELEALAKRLTALGANPDAQRLLRTVQLLQRNPEQASDREITRLKQEVDRLEASLRKPATPKRTAPQRAQ